MPKRTSTPQATSDQPLATSLRQRAAEVHERLLKEYGAPKWTRLDGISELVATILSQNTNDGNRDVAYARLRARFPTWEQARDADVDKVIEAIKPAGLANQKGPRIQAALKKLLRNAGS